MSAGQHHAPMSAGTEQATVINDTIAPLFLSGCAAACSCSCSEGSPACEASTASVHACSPASLRSLTSSCSGPPCGSRAAALVVGTQEVQVDMSSQSKKKA